MKKGLFVLMTAFSPALWAIEVYKCTTETGTTSYQQTPCQGDQPTMLESKGIVDAESYQQALKILSGALKNHQVSMLYFKWWKGFKNEVSDEFLHFKLTDQSGDTDIALLIDFIETEKVKNLDQVAIRKMVQDKGEKLERSSESGKTHIETMKLDDGYGYFATYKDASLVGKKTYPPGEYLNTTQGVLKKGEVLVNFTLLSNDTSAENHIFALQFLANGILIEPMEAELDPNISLLDQAYEEYHYGSKLKAMDLFEQLVREQPNEFKSWIGYCLALRDNNRLQMALVACDRALTFKPNDPDVLNSVMNVLIKGRQYDQALEVAHKLIQSSVKPQILSTINNLGFYAMIDGNLKVARQALNLVKREGGPTRKVMLDLAELDYLEGNKDRAIASFQSVAEQTQNDGTIQAYYLDPIIKGQMVHPPHSNSESYSEIPDKLLSVGSGQLSEAMVQPWVNRFYPILGVGRLELSVPESWAENARLAVQDKQSKQLSLVLGGADENLIVIHVDVGKVDTAWSLSDISEHMKSSMKLHFQDQALSLNRLDGDLKGFEFKGIASDGEFVHAQSSLDGVIVTDVVGVSLQDSEKNQAVMLKVINSIRLVDADQTALDEGGHHSNTDQEPEKSSKAADTKQPPGGPPTREQLLGYWKMIEWPNPDVQKVNPWPLPYQWFAFKENGQLLSMMNSDDSNFSKEELVEIFALLPKNSLTFELKGQFLTVSNSEINGYEELWGVNIFDRDMKELVKKGDLVMSLADQQTGEPIYYRLLRKVENW